MASVTELARYPPGDDGELDVVSTGSLDLPDRWLVSRSWPGIHRVTLHELLVATGRRDRRGLTVSSSLLNKS